MSKTKHFVSPLCFFITKIPLTKLELVPVKDVVVEEALPMEEHPEDLSQVAEVGPRLKVQLPAVVEVRGELAGEAAAQLLDGRRQLLLRDALVLLALVGRLQALPGQCAQVEIHKYVAERLQVVPPRLLDAQVRVDGRVARRARQVLVLPVRDVAVGARVPELLGQAKVDDVDEVTALAEAHQEVVRLDVSVDEVATVYVVDARYHLVGQ